MRVEDQSGPAASGARCYRGRVPQGMVVSWGVVSGGGLVGAVCRRPRPPSRAPLRPETPESKCSRGHMPPGPNAPGAVSLRGRVPPGSGAAWGGAPGSGASWAGCLRRRVSHGAVFHGGGLMGGVPGGRVPPRVREPRDRVPPGPDALGTDCFRGRVPPGTGDLDAIS